MEKVKRCPSFEGYSVSENGDVYSHRKRRKLVGKHGSEAYIDYAYFRMLRKYKNPKGYLIVSRVTDDINQPTPVQIFVADAYIRPRIGNELVRHLDDNKDNNHYKNLAYGTINDNNQDRRNNGKYFTGMNHHAAKLTNDQAKEIRELRAQKTSVKELANIYNVSISTIETVIYNKRYNSNE